MKKKIFTLLSIFIITMSGIIPVIAQTESKVAVLTVSGSGKTKDEAIQVALRNAIEQAFGTFISSNTQILNDRLVKDEIVSVSSGNIQEYNVISEVQTPDGYWSNTVKAKVAIDKLTSFCENKGVKVEFKGSLFALNIKQQMLNEQNELKAIENMRLVLKKIINRSFDFNISAGQPSSSGDFWKVPITIEGMLNNNFRNVSTYLFQTLQGITCIQSEIDNYSKLGKKLYFVAYKPMDVKDNEAGLFVLRNNESFKVVNLLMEDLRNAFINITIENGIERINLMDLDYESGDKYMGYGESPTCYDNFFNTRHERLKNIEKMTIYSSSFLPALSIGSSSGYQGDEANFLDRTHRTYDLNYKDIRPSNNSYCKFLSKIPSYPQEIKGGYSIISFDKLKIGLSKGIITFDNIYNVNDIQKITEYSIKPNY